jgi:cytochrome c-type biogenesis protein
LVLLAWGAGALSVQAADLPLTSGANLVIAKEITDANLGVLALLAFISGLLSFTSPCTLPILPAYFAFTFQADRKRIALMTVAFFAGLATVFVFLGGSASIIGGWLTQNVYTLTTVGGWFIIAFGVMSILGKGFTGLKVSYQHSATLGGSFLFGGAFALGWVACIGPILASLLVLAASGQTVLRGMLLLFIYAMGLGLPLIVVSTFFGRRDRNSLFWRFLRGKGWEVRVGRHTLYLHSTSILSGLLFVGLGAMMVTGYLTAFNRYIPVELQIWFLNLEEKLIGLFSG